MSDPRSNYVPPSVTEPAFNCPHCGVLAQQNWHQTHAEGLPQGTTPGFISERDVLSAERLTPSNDLKQHRQLIQLRRMSKGRPFLAEKSSCATRFVPNLSLSTCYNCQELAIWRRDRLLWPAQTAVPAPNSDLPVKVQDVYNEAGAIVRTSPRGAAALLRLGIQILCKSLGQKGKNINEDIRALVHSGLDPRVQKALDVVRVVGNHSVHPGVIDIEDDQATAMRLFGLVNLIADIMITQPKRVNEMYAELPEKDRDAIERRDK